MVSLMPVLYENLVSLCARDEGFYFKDVYLDQIKYRIFNYRLPVYSTFHSYPSALNCRGTMFDITDADHVRLVSLPPEKFFNYDEGPGARQHELGQFGAMMEKLDGSLISTFLHINQNNEQVVLLKSKASLESSQANESMMLLRDNFKAEIEQLVRQNYTINMEYTSPSNRIVVHYQEAKLTILSVRSHLTGETFFANRLATFLEENDCQTLLNHVVNSRDASPDRTQKDIIDGIRQETTGEGYVIEIVHPDGSWYLVKVKNNMYLTLHNCKDKLNSDRQLFEAIINETSDDLRTLFPDDQAALERIDRMENQVRVTFNKMVATVERFYDEHKHLSRKDFAITVMSMPSIKVYMPLLMNLYSGKSNDYKQFSLQNATNIFGINTKPKQSINVTDFDEE